MSAGLPAGALPPANSLVLPTSVISNEWLPAGPLSCPSPARKHCSAAGASGGEKENERTTPFAPTSSESEAATVTLTPGAILAEPEKHDVARS